MDRQTSGGASAPIFLSADLKAPHPTATSRKKILPVYMKSRRISIENKGILKDWRHLLKCVGVCTRFCKLIPLVILFYRPTNAHPDAI